MSEPKNDGLNKDLPQNTDKKNQESTEIKPKRTPNKGGYCETLPQDPNSNRDKNS